MSQANEGFSAANLILHHVTGVIDVAMGLEGLIYIESPVNFSPRAEGLEARQMQEVVGFTKYSPIWGNAYDNLKSLQYGVK